MTGLVLGVGLLACGKPSTGVPPIGPLSAEQKARLQITADSLADATQFKAKAMAQPALQEAGSVSEKRSQVMKTIEEQCQMGRESLPLPAPQPRTSAFKLRVASRSKNGDGKCPIDFSWETTTVNKLDDKGVLSGGRVDLVMHYAPTNDDAKAAFGAQRYDFNSGIDSTNQGTTVSYRGSGRGTASVLINGVLQEISLSSVAVGTIGTDATNFTSTYSVVYRDGLFVDLKLVLSRAGAGQPVTMTGSMNGVPVDPKELLPLLGQLGFETRLPTELKN